jgi:hypothetical protein
MSERESQIRSALTTYFPMLIAVLSLVTSIYNGYLNNKFVSIIQANLGRAEYMRSCKEIIDAYFQVKFRIGLLDDLGAQQRAGGTSAAGWTSAQIDAANAVNKFAALGTYLANLRDDQTRARYTQLSAELDKAMADVRAASRGDPKKRFEKADELFYWMNDDCVKSAQQAPI